MAFENCPLLRESTNKTYIKFKREKQGSEWMERSTILGSGFQFISLDDSHELRLYFKMRMHCCNHMKTICYNKHSIENKFGLKFKLQHNQTWEVWPFNTCLDHEDCTFLNGLMHHQTIYLHCLAYSYTMYKSPEGELHEASIGGWKDKENVIHTHSGTLFTH